MTDFKNLTYDDYEDVVDLCKDIWDGSDYLPEVFHKWVDDSKGAFIGAFGNNKLVSFGKYSVLIDNQGWLEGLRVHSNFRGKGYANLISDKLLNLAKEDLKNNKITNIGMCTHKDTTASIKMMTSRGFKLEQSCMFVFKNKDSLENLTINLTDFNIKVWDISYEKFANLNYFKNFKNRIVFGFTYMNLCEDVYADLVNTNSLLEINGYKCILKLKGDTPCLMCIDENIDSINTLANYCLLKYNCDEVDICLTNPTEKLISDLKIHDFDCVDKFEDDCLYFLYK